MKEKPILFSTPMVQAILAGRKTQTRRVIKPQFPIGLPEGKYRYDGIQEGIHAIELLDGNSKPTEKYFHCGKPRFVPGDVLWVRETFTSTDSGEIIYKADPIFEYCTPGDIAWNWKPSIYMKHEAARFFLEVLSVHVERLRTITPEDKRAEGFSDCSRAYPCGEKDKCELHCFMKTWDTINAKRGYSWSSNPWVWVIEFKRIEK